MHELLGFTESFLSHAAAGREARIKAADQYQTADSVRRRRSSMFQSPHREFILRQEANEGEPQNGVALLKSPFPEKLCPDFRGKGYKDRSAMHVSAAQTVRKTYR